MIKKIIKTGLFICAIGIGIFVGHGFIQASSFVYNQTFSYVSEIDIPFILKKESDLQVENDLSIPISQEIESDLNQDDIYARNFNIKTKTVPSISSLSYLVADLETGKVLLHKNINQQLSIASITKLMTALIADEIIGLDTQTQITQKALDTYGTQGDLKINETYSIQELLYPLLLESSNDAGEAMALSKDRDLFLMNMNQKAKDIGLLNTQFVDASGLGEGNKSTVTDLFRLTQYLSKYKSYIFEITTFKTKDLGKKTWINNSRFRSNPDYLGGKNGYTTEAGKTHIVLFDEKFKKETRPVVYIILKSEDVAGDIDILRSFVQKNIEYK